MILDGKYIIVNRKNSNQIIDILERNGQKDGIVVKKMINIDELIGVENFYIFSKGNILNITIREVTQISIPNYIELSPKILCREDKLKRILK